MHQRYKWAGTGVPEVGGGAGVRGGVAVGALESGIEFAGMILRVHARQAHGPAEATEYAVDVFWPFGGCPHPMA